MACDKEIKQPECISKKKYRNEYHKALVNVLYTSCWANEQLKNYICEECITVQQYNILRILHDNGKPMSILQIRNLLLDKMSDASRIVDRMIGKELVQKTVCALDKRLVDIYLTAKGEEILRKLDMRICEMDSALQSLTLAEAQQLNFLLDKMRGQGE